MRESKDYEAKKTRFYDLVVRRNRDSSSIGGAGHKNPSTVVRLKHRIFPEFDEWFERWENRLEGNEKTRYYFAKKMFEELREIIN